MSVPSAGAPLTPVQEGIETALQVAYAGVWEIDLSDLSTVFSDGYYHLLGLEPLPGRRPPEFWQGLVHPEDQARVSEAFLQYALNPVGVYEHEYRLRHADGHWKWVLARGRAVERNADGSCRRAMGFIVDVSERSKALDGLQRSEQRFRVAVKAMRGMVYEVDLASNHITQHGVEQLLGYNPAPDSNSLDVWLAVIHPDDRNCVKTVIQAHRQTGVDYSLTYRVQHVDGRMLHVWHRGTYLHNEQGVPERAIGVVEDVTSDWRLREELRITEQALRESQQMLRTVADSSPVHMSMFDCERRCLFANRTLSGRDTSEVIGMRLEELLPIAQADFAIQCFDRALTGGVGIDLTTPFRFPGMDLRYFHAMLRPVIRDGKTVGVVANVSDITDSRRQEDQQRLQASIIEHMREGVLLLDREANILFTNPALDAMFGYGVGELLGRNSRLLSPDDKRGFSDIVQRALSGSGGDAMVELEGRSRDGVSHMLQCLVTGTEIQDERCVIVVVTDVSEHQRLQRELLQVEARVQHQIGSDLHDGVGQQLAGIAMMLKGLVRRIGVGDSRELRGDVQRIIDFVNEALQSTRSLARGLAPVRTDREGLFEGFEELAQHVYDRYRVRVHLGLDLPEGDHFDENSASNLYRIAQEGVLNAARHGKASQIEVGLSVNDSMAELVIVDDGSGFDPHKVGRGGMGLRVMRFRAQMLGGYLSVESRPGDGTTLRCRCPLRPEREAA